MTALVGADATDETLIFHFCHDALNLSCGKRVHRSQFLCGDGRDFKYAFEDVFYDIFLVFYDIFLVFYDIFYDIVLYIFLCSALIC